MTGGDPSYPAIPAPDQAQRAGGPRESDPRLLEILVCPVSRTTLEFDRVKQELVSQKAKLAFPIRDGIPVMLTDEARKILD